jgi:Holliday junction resolvasome RuvABC endonuclease subunit
MNTLISLDIDSFKIAIAVFDKGIPTGTMIIAADKKLPADDRAVQLFKDFAIFLEKTKPEVVVMERPLYNQNFTSSRTITEVVAYCKLSCSLLHIPYELVHVSTWKKIAIGKGNATKQEIMTFINKRYPWTKGLTQDECDALSIGLYFVEKKKDEQKEV